MTRTRRRVRLTKRDWARIYTALCVMSVRDFDSETLRRGMRTTMRRVGYQCMAARDRGVAPVRRAPR